MKLSDIKKFINNKIRPTLGVHGGGIKIISLQENVVKLKLLGECSKCPASQFTIENLIKKSLKMEFPELREVKVENNVSQDLLNQAKKILKDKNKD